MKIVVIGGTGLIGSKLVNILHSRGHEAVAAAPNTGVNTITGEGLAQALSGAAVVVDVANSPSFEEKAVLEFFEASGRNLLAAEKVAGVRHHVALSIVGTERLQGSGYFRGKMLQETLIRASGVPFTIVHSTQFFEFLGSIAKSGVKGETIHLSSALIQPISADDVAEQRAAVALSAPANDMIEIAGPDRAPLADLVRRYLRTVNDTRPVAVDPKALYFGIELDDTSLVPSDGFRVGSVRLDSWLEQQQPAT